MNGIQRATRSAVWLFIVLLSVVCTMAAEPFKESELKRFLAAGAPVLDWIRTNGQPRVLDRLLENPRSINEWTNAVRLLADRGWQPERFGYILQHVIIASKRLGMGRDPGKLLARLEETKAAALQNPGPSDSVKEQTLKIVAEAQREAGSTDKAFAEIPPEEVRLMWIYRAEIRRVLEDHLPMRKRDLPNPDKAP